MGPEPSRLAAYTTNLGAAAIRVQSNKACFNEGRMRGVLYDVVSQTYKEFSYALPHLRSTPPTFSLGRLIFN